MKGSMYWIVVIFTILKCTDPLPDIPSMTMIWMVGMGVLLAYALAKDGTFSTSATLMSFCVVVLLGFLAMQPPAYFRSGTRFTFFVYSIAFLSPFFSSPTLRRIRAVMLKVTLNCLSVIVIACFIAYFLGINYANIYRHEGETALVGFSGITYHSMTLCPCASLCFLTYMWRLFFLPYNKKRFYFDICMVGICAWVMIAAGSRGSLGAAVIGVIPIIYHLRKRSKVATRLVIIGAIAIALIPSKSFDKLFYTINQKQEYAESQQSMTATRDAKWASLWQDFKESPIFGQGFAAQKNFSTREEEDVAVLGGGRLEPGSSWLCVLSMTGILGLITIFAFLYKSWKDLRKKYRYTARQKLMMGMFIFFFLHGFVEGWIFYAGGFLFYLYWLTMGNVTEEFLNSNDEIIAVKFKQR